MQRNRLALTLVELLIVIAIIVVAIALLVPNVRTAREPARRNLCLNNLKQIALALLTYEEEHGTLPPAYTVDENGNRLHSWRTLILPYLEQTALYETIDLTKPWDDPANAKARETVVEVYQCPSSPEPLGLTNYLAVVGPDCAFTGSEPRNIADVKNDTRSTVTTIMDVGTNRAIPWMSPEDITPEAALALIPDAKMNHPGMILTTFLDGHVKTVSQDVDPNVLRGMLTITGSEESEE